MIVQSGNDATVALAEHVGGHRADLRADDEHLREGARHDGLALHELPRHARPRALHDGARLGRSSPARSSASSRSTTAGTRSASSPGTASRSRTATACCGATRPWTASRPATPRPPATASSRSAQRDGMRLVSVVLGTESMRAREDANAALLNYGFNFFETKRLYAAGEPLTTARVWKGETAEVGLALKRDLFVTGQRGQTGSVKAEFELPGRLMAPLATDTADRQGEHRRGRRDDRDPRPLPGAGRAARRPVPARERHGPPLVRLTWRRPTRPATSTARCCRSPRRASRRSTAASCSPTASTR